jgi:hypothetical protein
MDSKIKQHVCIKFCVKFSKSATKTLFGEYFLSQTTVFEWYLCFKAGQMSVEDDECSGQPSSSKTTKNAEKI